MCHAPSALLATRIHGESPFKGYRVTGFTNEEELAVGLADKAQWLLEDELKEKIGVEFSRGPIWEPYTVEDHNLFTGQNPSSAAVLAQRLMTGRVLAGPVLDGLRHGSLRRVLRAGPRRLPGLPDLHVPPGTRTGPGTTSVPGCTGQLGRFEHSGELLRYP
ncbi:hypothetical protein [Streptomyces sp. NPDC001137]|uniref:hypothetical protein n=1 Tax=Streptomyces sp. NPDC001137 TaxID=3154378 RepID=UPI00332B6033